MNFKKILLLVSPIIFVGFGFYLKQSHPGEDVLLKAITENLKNYHYSPIAIDDSFSAKAHAVYLENLDLNKRYFIESDIEKLKKYEFLIDDEIEMGTYKFLDTSTELLKKAIDRSQKYYEHFLSKPFDLTADESVNFSEDSIWAKNEKVLKERWRKYLKYNVLTRVYSDLETQNKAIANNDTTVKILSIDSLEAKARRSVLKTHNDWYERLKKRNRKDDMSLYVNSIISLYDPHTNFYPPEDKENFDIQMSGRLEGIGAQLQEKDGYIKITNVIPGGPAFMQGELKENDQILKVAQGNDDPVDVVGWRIDDAVKLIRGKKGTVVNLTVRKTDASIKKISITRDIVVLEETYAKSLILSDNNGKKTGYLMLPSFYADFNDPEGRFSWKDVDVEIQKLKSEGIEGLIFDVRNNGGGSLDDVVKITGMFIDKGPVVQVKEQNRAPHILSDVKSGSIWDGPLVVMVNEFSASASEILAAALQDYNRAIVIGSTHSHGKGTVQRFLPLNQTLRDKSLPNLGSIKLTTQKFYRINGASTQLKGVIPDVLLPDFYKYIETGEKENEFAIAWDETDPTNFKALTFDKKAELVQKSNQRISGDTTFNLVEANAIRWKQKRDKNEYTLNLEKYIAQQKEDQKNDEKYENIFKPIPSLLTANPSIDSEYINRDSSRIKRNTDWINAVKKDPYVFEGYNILKDWTK